MTPLGEQLADLIRSQGPIGVDRFMAAALGDPVHGYYRTRDPLGAGGDFITAPEISQVFGEIIGLWLAEQWRVMGAPDPVLLVELGPGRGTLMADVLRALRVVPACRATCRVHLVETSAPLRERQRATLAEAHPDIVPTWHDAIETLPDGALLLVANEFFDALPIRQFVYRNAFWHERQVGLDPSGGFEFIVGPALGSHSFHGERSKSLLPSREEVGGGGSTPPAPSSRPPPARGGGVNAVASPIDGTIFETCEPGLAIAKAIGGRLRRSPGAGLIVDYGHAPSGFGETLQAVRAHRYDTVLASPGEADLTAHVDFAALGEALRRGGAEFHGPVSQAAFLTENGALLREQVLTGGRTDEPAKAIRRAVRRLIEPAAMGTLFKAVAATSPGLPRPSGF